MAGNRTQNNCLEGSYAHHYTTITCAWSATCQLKKYENVERWWRWIGGIIFLLSVFWVNSEFADEEWSLFLQTDWLPWTVLHCDVVNTCCWVRLWIWGIFQKVGYVKMLIFQLQTEVTSIHLCYRGNELCQHKLLAGRFSWINSEYDRAVWQRLSFTSQSHHVLTVIFHCFTSGGEFRLV